MKKISHILFATGLIALPALADNLQDRAEASRNAAKEFQGMLGGELKAAIAAGGPVNAIQVCNKKAGEIADDISKKHGWKVGRTSLKVRNTANAPDAWETKVLKDFDARKAKGDDPTKLEHSEVVKQDGKSVFRYMKAIPIPQDAPCLACHGEKIDGAVAAKLKELYPQDKATGYKQGDLRGAFTITQPL